MKFSATFVSSFGAIEKLPSDGRPEIAIIGRSNVGKSSLINALTERKQLAKTSGTPGKTRTLNYFDVNSKFYLVDMPGFGYAKQAKSERAQWARLIERYFLERENLVGVGLLIDSRHPEIESDIEAIEWLREQEIPVFVVLTKCDKSKQAEIAKHIHILTMVFGALPILPTSSVRGSGMEKLRKFIEKLAETRNFEVPPVLANVPANE